MSVTRRLPGTLLCALAVLCALPAVASARPFARAKVADCDVSLVPGASHANFEARMRAVPGTQRMLMRFTLEERFGSERYEPVKVRDLLEWRESEPGVQAFTYTQRIRALQPGGLYRVRVEFRWYGSKGRLIEQVRRRSPACGKPGPLPNLRIGDIRARLGSAAGTIEYEVDVLNTGTATAEDIPVAFAVDGATLDERAISALKPGETETVSFSGPSCSQRVRAEVDPDEEIHESNEDDNVRGVACASFAGGR